MTIAHSHKRALRRLTGGASLAALALFVSTIGALAQAIVVQGNRRVDTQTIRSYVDGQSPDAARKDLMATGLFSRVEVSARGGQTIVSVRENEVINRVVFEGNKKLKTEVIIGELQSKAGGPFSQASADADAARVREIYQRSGRGNASVNVRTVALDNGRVDVVFTVVEGEKTGVKSIEFTGNQAFSSGRLRDQMTTTESNFLSWLKTSDVYDPDRVSSDLELIRRYYLRNGYADFRVVSTDVRFDDAKSGYVITITVDEGAQYKIGNVSVESRIPDVDANRLRGLSKVSPGDTYNADAVEKSLVAMTTEIASRGYAFAQVRPRGDRDFSTHSINLSYIVEEGPRVYIERLNIRGNTRTRDYVIRREFDLGEGDAYNKVMIDRAERRLNNLGYFKKVRITNEPGSTPDRVVVNVEVEDQPTGQLSVSGGYSTSDGFIGEVAVAETNLLGRGQYARLAGSLGQYSSGVEFNFTEPYFLDQRLAAGFDVYNKQSDNTRYARYENRMTGGTLRVGLPLTEEITAQMRYSIYQQEVKIPNDTNKPYNNCSTPIANYAYNAYPDCVNDGEASLALKEAVGTTLTSLAGYTLSYNTLDNNKNPRSGIYGEFRQDVAGIGGDSKYIRSTAEGRYYHEITDDFVGMVKVQGGYLTGKNLKIVDNFFMGPQLVRGFAPSGIGPRDVTVDPRNNALGGTTYFGGTTELQFPIFGLPREVGLKGALFADAGTLFGYDGKTDFASFLGTSAYCPAGGTTPTKYPTCVTVRDKSTIRSSVGVSVLWASPLGPIRFDFAHPITKDTYDRTQVFRFTGGTAF
jgi:outer membrane protein insertion porin family